MNENAKKKARQKEVIEGIKAKYDKDTGLTEDKKEVLKSWIKGLEKREATKPSSATEKDKALVLKMYRKIEEREKKRKS
ncbi:MAG: hypothetical protein V1875_01235 [Candidatus Altiarchaeota archaeon]